MDPAVIGSIFAGVTGLVTAVFGFLLNRTKVQAEHATEDVSEMRAELATLRTQFQAALLHIYELRGVMSAHNLSVPAMPDELATRRNRHQQRGETA